MRRNFLTLIFILMSMACAHALPLASENLFDLACPEVTLYTYPKEDITLYKGTVGYARIPGEKGNRLKVVAGPKGIELTTTSGIYVGGVDWGFMNHLKLKRLSYDTGCGCTKTDTDLKFDLFGLCGGAIDFLGDAVFNTFLADKVVPTKFREKGYDLCLDENPEGVLKDLLESYGKFLDCAKAPDRLCDKLTDSQISIGMTVKKEIKETREEAGKKVVSKIEKGARLFVNINTKGPLASPRMDLVEIFPSDYTKIQMNEAGDDGSLLKTVYLEKISIRPDGKVDVKVRISAERTATGSVQIFNMIMDGGIIRNHDREDPKLKEDREMASRLIGASVQKMTQQILQDYGATIDKSLKAHLPNFSMEKFWPSGP